MTGQEAEKEIACYRKIFSEVRLLGADEMEKLDLERKTGMMSEQCQCYRFW